MLKFQLILLAGLLSSAAIAERLETNTLVPPDTKSYMDQVVDWYEAGQNLTLDNFNGVYSGRCFTFDDPNVAKNNMLFSLNADAGPAFSTKPYALLSSLQKLESADYYDNLENLAPVLSLARQLAKQAFRKGHYGPIDETPTAHQQWDLEPNGRFDFTVSYRMFHGYIIRIFTNLIGQNLDLPMMSRRSYLDSGKVGVACYYFKKIAD